MYKDHDLYSQRITNNSSDLFQIVGQGFILPWTLTNATNCAIKAEVFSWQVTAFGEPLLISTLFWTFMIFCRRRNRWRSADVLIAAILLQGIIKQTVTLTYAILTYLRNWIHIQYGVLELWGFKPLCISHRQAPLQRVFSQEYLLYAHLWGTGMKYLAPNFPVNWFHCP